MDPNWIVAIELTVGGFLEVLTFDCQRQNGYNMWLWVM
jgi:hypothetical protein